MKRNILVIALVLFGYSAKSQVLISILLGDKLNSDKLEFGLEGGWNLSSISGIDHSKPLSTYNLGFYFDIKVFKNPQLMLNTGVIVKSSQGARNIPLYSLNDANLDSAFVGGSVTRKISYFNVPVEIKYLFKNRIYTKAGIMLGLRYKGTDEFVNKIKDDDDLSYKLDIRKKSHPIDAGAVVGLGYRLSGGNGMNIGAQYYYGFIDTTIDDSGPNEYNSGLYVTVCIPIGKGKAEKKAAE